MQLSRFPLATLFCIAVSTGAAAGEAVPGEPPAEAPASGDVPVITASPPSESPAPVPEAEEPAAALPEIVVTATKRAESLREIPASITSMSGSELEERNVQGAQDIAKLVPGVNYSESGDGPATVSIRGISPQPATSFTTGVLFGDVSFTDAYVPLVSLDPNPFDLKSVDVLKGPQGTLFGASALNGAIRYVPVQPELGEWEAKYFGDFTRYRDGDFEPTFGGAVNVPVGDEAALRITGLRRRTPGFVDNLRTGDDDSNSIEQNGIRGIALWQPADILDVKLTYATQHTHIDDASTTANEEGHLSSDVRPRLSPQRNAYELTDLNVALHFDWADLVSETAYLTKKMHNYFDASSRFPGSPPISAQVYSGHSTAWTQELRLVSPNGADSDWRWVAGLFWSRQRIDNLLDIVAGNDAIPTADVLALLDTLFPGLGGIEGPDGAFDLLTTESKVKVTEKALFFDVTRRFLEDFELTVGGRLYDTSSGGTNELSGLLTTVSRGQPEVVTEATVGDRAFNPHASLSWHFTDKDLAFAAISKGFRVGGVQAGAALLPTDDVPEKFESDTIWNYESGVRTQWLGNTVRFDLTGFYTKWNKPQYLQPDSAGVISFISNVGGVKSQGGELSLQWLLPFGGLMFGTSVGYTDTRTTKPFEAAGGKNVAVGTRWPFSSDWQTVTTLSQIADLGNFEIRSGVTHIYIGDATNNLTQKAPILGYEQWDLNFSVSNSAIAWLPTFSLNVSNLFDKRGVMNHVFAGNDIQPYNDVLYVKPRQITLRLSGSF